MTLSPLVISLLATWWLAIGQTAKSSTTTEPIVAFQHRAVLQSPGGELPFLIEYSKGGNRAWFRNAGERIEVLKRSNEGRSGVFEIPEYDSTIEFGNLAWCGTGITPGTPMRTLEGKWLKKTGKGDAVEMLFFAETFEGYRFKPNLKVTLEVIEYPPVAGRWSVKFADDKESTVGVFKELPNKVVEGTFLTTTGDYRYLAGSYENGLLRLSCFDGAHAFLFHANMQKDGTLKGDFWSGPKYHDTWTAKRDDKAALPDGFTLAKVNPKARLKDLKFRDLDGKELSPGDASLLGKATIIEIFGSWCPNCHDAANLLVEMEKKYGPRGMRVVGLAFEATGDLDRDAQQVRRYMQRHNATYPVLLAGMKDKAKASASLPVIDGLKGYPTFLFIDQDGRITKVYTGFSGPATGKEYEELKLRFERVIERLLAQM